FIRIYRDAHPTTPILVVSRIRYAHDQHDPVYIHAREERKAFQQGLVNDRRAQGDRHIFFFDGSTLLGEEDYGECTVDGVHPTDVGFLRMARGLEPVLKTLLL